MRFSEKWLREWVDPPLDTAQLAHQLTMAGLEVDETVPVAAVFTGIVVAEIVSVSPHPDADKLRVCEVNSGEGEILQIVCGAPNATAGMRAPLAKVGACLPGMKIKKGKLRGVESFGMLCSAEELGLAEEAEGLLDLPADAPVGLDIREYLQLDDTCIEMDLTPNRSDCLGIMGIAREVGALTRCALKQPDITSICATAEDTFPLDNQVPQACPHYVGRVIKGVNAAAQTPLWMRERLRRSGLRSISAVVDITNYVLLELGQPMHAFDLEKLSGGIQVRMAQQGELLTLLDGQEVSLDSSTLVIADHNKVLAMAGIMGGAASAVNAGSCNIFLESAYFNPLHLAGCARRYGLHTDSSHRFERGVDPQLQAVAIERATALLVEITGGQPGPLTESKIKEYLPDIQPIMLRGKYLERLLGVAVPGQEIDSTLQALGMQVETLDNGNYRVVPPSFRFDIRLEADLIEELARVHGYHRLPRDLPRMEMNIRSLSCGLQGLQNILVQRGYQEVITYSFVNPGLQEKLTPHAKAVPLSNPLASDMSVMRTTLWSGLIPVLQHNLKRQQNNVRLFESGLHFRYHGDGKLKQENMLAGIVHGTVMEQQWGESERVADFFDLKADVEALFGVGQGDLNFCYAEHPALHPGQSASVVLHGEVVGVLGTIHPAIAYSIDLPSDVYLFEVSVSALERCREAARKVRFHTLSKFPSVRRDIAVVLEQDYAVAGVMDCVRKNATGLLSELELFDVYQGKGIEPGYKSLALGLTFRATERSLIEQEIDNIVAQVLQSLKIAFGATLRE